MRPAIPSARGSVNWLFGPASTLARIVDVGTSPTTSKTGQVVVCAVYFEPVAGFIPSRASVKYLTSQRDMEVWLAPIAGTRVMVPYRISIPTPVGVGVMEATQFVTSVQPRAAASGGAKSQ